MRHWGACVSLSSDKVESWSDFSVKTQTGGRQGLSLTAHLLCQFQNKNSSLPCHDPPFTNGETEAQRRHMACPRSHRKDIKDASGGMGKSPPHPHPVATRFPFQKQEYSDFLRYFRHIQAFTHGSCFLHHGSTQFCILL